MIPGLFAMQVRALAEAAQALREQGLDQRPEVVVPLVGAVFGVRPFESIDREGVGLLVRTAVDEGRGRAGLGAGVWGEHGGDPDSVHFFHDTGLDYVSCSPCACRSRVRRLGALPRPGARRPALDGATAPRGA